MDIIGFTLSLIIFILYLLLWTIKRISLIKKTKIDANVFSKSKSPLQHYMFWISNFLTVYIIICLILHLLNAEFLGIFTSWSLLNSIRFDIAGFIISLIGLSFCLYAQIKMGLSWRVGIDEKNKTTLITSGLYKYIRNPTYLGLFIMDIGVFIILPTISIFFFIYSFFLFLEIQVRCEEEFLEKLHGKEYIEYKRHTKRYIPFVY